MILKRESAEIYADFTLSRIPLTVRNELTTEQLLAIRRALVAEDPRTKHSLDVRLRIPLFFRQYYFVLLGGRDRRATTIKIELNRIRRVPKGGRRLLYLFAAGVILAGLLAVFFSVLYLIKSFLGIDIFQDYHLSDLLPFDLFGLAKGLLGE